ncbi:MAG: hypothetical protein JNM17_16045 [Archangium sp.]|nr:hypothetical protein [Archangium sp.]
MSASHLSSAGLALALGLSGCGTDHAATRPAPETPAAASPSRAELQRAVEQSLAKLEGLQLVSGPSLVLKLEDNARGCYGVPCPGDAQGQKAYDAELARQSTRLAAFVEQLDACNSGHCYVSSPQTAQEAVDALNALEIIRVSALATAEPKNNPSCYNLPCGEDIEAARAENARRERVTFTAASMLKER